MPCMPTPVQGAVMQTYDLDLAKLPLGARVALAARCARRVLPVFAQWALTSAHRTRLLEAVLDAVSFAEETAGGAEVEASWPSFQAGAHTAAVRAVEDGASSAACAAAHAAASAASAAANARQGGGAVIQTSEALHAANFAALGSEQHEIAVISEYHALRAVSEKYTFGDEARVQADFFPPLPTQSAAGAERRDSRGLGMVSEFVVDLDAEGGKLLEFLEAFADCADELYRAEGGHGLCAVEVEILDEARVAEGVLR